MQNLRYRGVHRSLHKYTKRSTCETRPKDKPQLPHDQAGLTGNTQLTSDAIGTTIRSLWEKDQHPERLEQPCKVDLLVNQTPGLEGVPVTGDVLGEVCVKLYPHLRPSNPVGLKWKPKQAICEQPTVVQCTPSGVLLACARNTRVGARTVDGVPNCMQVLGRCCGNHVRTPSRPSTRPPIVATLALSRFSTSCHAFRSFPLVTCRRHSSYLAPCATSTCYRTISHRHDSPSATLSSAYIYSPCTYCI